nr:MAG TPA: hypothetical protein [Caudoviricetes sp.]
MKRAYNIIAGRKDAPPMYLGMVIAPSLMAARRAVNTHVYTQPMQPEYVQLEQIARLPDETPDYVCFKVVGIDVQII